MSSKMTRVQQDLVRNNIGLAKAISMDYITRAPGLDLDEVMSAAYQGLADAATKYDATTGVPFGAYARRRIHGEILEWQRKEDYLQRYIRVDLKKMEAAGYDPTKQTDWRHLAKVTGLPIERMTMIVQVVRAQPTSTENLVEAEDVLGDPDANTESSSMTANLLSSVAGAFQELPALQQAIVALHYFEGKELRQIAEFLGIGVSTVRNAHTEAISILHAEMLRQAREHS